MENVKEKTMERFRFQRNAFMTVFKVLYVDVLTSYSPSRGESVRIINIVIDLLPSNSGSGY